MKFGADFSKRLLLYIPHDANAEENLARLGDLVRGVLQGKDDNIVIQLGGIDDETQLFENADVYITSRALRTARRSCIADLYGVLTVSGVDEPLFWGVE
ncbi:MAG: hypothetical protein LBD92_00835 [Oscillospiraceae bacterium]|nr:hypothetical protein [Oscillospiraceae bacterium]